VNDDTDTQTAPDPVTPRRFIADTRELEVTYPVVVDLQQSAVALFLDDATAEQLADSFELAPEGVHGFRWQPDPQPPTPADTDTTGDTDALN
jgi:hypothetical protein